MAVRVNPFNFYNLKFPDFVTSINFIEKTFSSSRKSSHFNHSFIRKRAIYRIY
ncbi:hypothetical protein HanPSC8_Chr04g0155681 [Helianthus annuus]|uniref:Uncharacterized protein n=1 Tax=Helianthus annuus TaxID=4232 RepID=A0A251UXH5_HELAN|nr:hypothetical protein HanPSC8_Chr04g0155681 [Helianthus annuus]